MKKSLFEEFLQEKHGEDYHGLDDDMPDAYEKWISEMQIDDVISLGEEFGQKQYELGQKEIKEEKKGKCCLCQKLTSNKNKFADDMDEEGNATGYEDFCCEECYEHLLDKLN